MTRIDKIKISIELLRKQLNDLIEKGEEGSKVLIVSQQLDELVLEYYKCIDVDQTTK